METENPAGPQSMYSGNFRKIEVVDANKFLLLYMLSFGLYGVWWMYKTWNFFKEKELSDIVPVARAIFSIFFLYSLLEKIQNFAVAVGYEKRYPSLLIFIGIIAMNVFSRLEDPLWLIALGSGFFYLPAVNAFVFAIENAYGYEAENPSGYNKRQAMIIAIGAVAWFLLLIGLTA